jgi:hypothetical protein
MGSVFPEPKWQPVASTILMEEVSTTTMIVTNNQVVVDPRICMWMQITIAIDQIICHSSNNNSCHQTTNNATKMVAVINLRKAVSFQRRIQCSMLKL